MIGLYFIVLSMMCSLSPSENPIHRHGALATAITLESVSDPLYRDDPLRTAALMVAVAFRESSLDNRAVGDGGHSKCAFQIYDGPDSLLEDPHACAAWAHRMLKQSIHIDREHPIAFYARGPAFRSAEARRISDDRVRIAQGLLANLSR